MATCIGCMHHSVCVAWGYGFHRCEHFEEAVVFEHNRFIPEDVQKALTKDEWMIVTQRESAKSIVEYLLNEGFVHFIEEDIKNYNGKTDIKIVRSLIKVIKPKELNEK